MNVNFVSCSLTYTFIHSHSLTHLHLHSLAFTRIHSHSLAFTRIHSHSLTHAFIHTHSHTFTFTHIHSHIHSLTHSHTFTHIHIRTHRPHFILSLCNFLVIINDFENNSSNFNYLHHLETYTPPPIQWLAHVWSLICHQIR